MANNKGKSGRTPQQKSASRAQSSADKNPSGKLAKGGYRQIQSSADKKAAASRKSGEGKTG